MTSIFLIYSLLYNHLGYLGRVQESFCMMLILRQLHNLPINIQPSQLRPWILPPRVDEPPRCCQHDDAHKDDAIIVHR